MLSASVISLAIVARSQKLLQAATTDPLTGLHNRGYIDDRLANELSRAHRYNKPLTIAVIDADHFKLLNDTHGHPAGDRVLQHIGETLRNSFRQSDTAGRYGGEEFVVILPETDIETAQAKLESLQRIYRQHSGRAGRAWRENSCDRQRRAVQLPARRGKCVGVIRAG